tara:strand:+ start:152 stop:394 length:243 start_codon:yes stop_codon:yes gene_type:complete
MIKIWFLLMLISMPNQPTVKYQGFLFPTEEQCVTAQARYLNEYESKSPEYKAGVIIDAHCLPFEAFPVEGMNYNKSSFGA